MHVLFATVGYKPAYRIGGPIVSVAALAEHLVARGHRVTVFTTDSNMDRDLDVPLDQPVDVEGVEVWYFHRDDRLQARLLPGRYFRKSMGFLYAPRMRRQLEAIMPSVDVVHCHMPFIYPTYAAAVAARRWNRPLVYHQRGVFDPQRLQFRSLKKRAYIRLVERPIMRQAAMLVALTEAEEASYGALGVATPCRVVPNGVDVAAYRQQPRQDCAARWRIPAGAQVILFLGRLHPIKGADKLLEAFRQVAAEVPHAMLVMAGPDEWGLERQFRQSVDLAGLAHRVLFPGMVDGDDKHDLLARADLFCLPSDAEGFSMAVLEALASRTAVLLSPGCHFPAVESAGAGRIAEAHPDSLADALRKLLSDPPALRKMGDAGVELVKNHYSWPRITDQMLDAYQAGIERHRKKRHGRTTIAISGQAAA